MAKQRNQIVPLTLTRSAFVVESKTREGQRKALEFRDFDSHTYAAAYMHTYQSSQLSTLDSPLVSQLLDLDIVRSHIPYILFSSF